MLGLAARAGAVVPGTERVRQAARGGTLRYAIVASDLTGTGRDKLIPLLEWKEVEHAVRYTRAQLGAAVGRAPLAAVGVTDGSFARRLRVLVAEAAGAIES